MIPSRQATFVAIAIANIAPLFGVLVLGWSAISGLALFAVDLFALAIFGVLHLVAAQAPRGTSPLAILPLAALLTLLPGAMFYQMASGPVVSAGVTTVLGEPALPAAMLSLFAWRFVTFVGVLLSPQARHAPHAPMHPMLPISAGVAIFWLVNPQDWVAAVLLLGLCVAKAAVEVIDARYGAEDDGQPIWIARAARRFVGFR
ncbi:hypothetical protein [Terricaulis sp.]|uniref:hypothetical protein n=1 Tax=Terricaulis sp. TaxID=2768686 RepID=UPI0037840339